MSRVANWWDRLPACRFVSIQAGSLFYVALSVLLLAPSTTLSAAEADFDTKAYLQTHCIRCHGEEEQNADRRFDSLGAELSDHQISRTLAGNPGRRQSR